MHPHSHMYSQQSMWCTLRIYSQQYMCLFTSIDVAVCCSMLQCVAVCCSVTTSNIILFHIYLFHIYSQQSTWCTLLPSQHSLCLFTTTHVMHPHSHLFTTIDVLHPHSLQSLPWISTVPVTWIWCFIFEVLFLINVTLITKSEGVLNEGASPWISSVLVLVVGRGVECTQMIVGGGTVDNDWAHRILTHTGWLQLVGSIKL